MREKKAKKTLGDVQKTWNQIASKFSASRKNLDHDFKTYEKYFQEGQKIVDLCCGNGRLYKLIQEKMQKEVNYLGIDNSEGLLKEAQKNFPQAKFIFGDQLKIPLPDKDCDILCNIRAFHHLPSKKLRNQALQEMKRVLKPGGTLILTCWNVWNPKQMKYIYQAGIKSILNIGATSYKDTFIPWQKKIDRYYYAFTFNELKKIITKNGFTIIESQKLDDLIIIAKS